jgi:hypothetical protein
MTPKGVKRFAACAKSSKGLPGRLDASAGEGRSDNIRLKAKA